MKYKIKFTVEIGVSSKRSVDMTITKTLTFLPPVDMQIVVASGDNFRTVDELYWSEGDGFECQLAFDDLSEVDTLKLLGWREQ